MADLRRFHGQRYESAQVWSKYGRVRVQLSVGDDATTRQHSLANHFTRWQAIKLAARLVLRALDPRPL